ncbi:hypothetical protein CIL05_06810 [Virgibacillus profundi]|uniref:Uncharacterized protein n=1 Tax=Virgibacillus profundi TaxID=2024555 RepID=A0A2A2IF44_9BACI|nr:hypothetical protein [Virgibacillus profundi]PAV30172.1 hypothetical protein CIL05_06810 [Virgibacillus profundi]PXY54344.1 hypothetical protein CIT14_06895 [Virgibacillus profundi]
MAKYKVHNNNGFRVGIRYDDSSNREQVIMPRTFIHMEEDDILYVDAVSQLFRKGVIFTEDQGMLEKMGYLEKNANTVSEKEVAAILKLGVGKMKTELKKLDAKHAIDKVINVAKKDQDLSQAKLKVIGDLYDVEIFDAIDEDII